MELSRPLCQIAAKGAYTILSLPAFQTFSLVEKLHRDEQSTY